MRLSHSITSSIADFHNAAKPSVSGAIERFPEPLRQRYLRGEVKPAGA
jgi:hypothetical protein